MLNLDLGFASWSFFSDENVIYANNIHFVNVIIDATLLYRIITID